MGNVFRTVYNAGLRRVTNLLIGGASVSLQWRIEPLGNSSLTRRSGMPATSGLRGLSNVKSYHNTPPPGFAHAPHALSQIRLKRSIQHRSKDRRLSNYVERLIGIVELHCVAETEVQCCGQMYSRSVQPGFSNSVAPTRFAGSNPSRRNCSSVFPVPQPTSRTRLV